MIGPHKQYLLTTTFKCTSVENYYKEIGQEEDYVYDKDELEEEVDEICRGRVDCYVHIK